MTCPQEGIKSVLTSDNVHHKVVDEGVTVVLAAVETRWDSWLHNGVTSSTGEHIKVPARGAGTTPFGHGDCVGTLGGVMSHSFTRE